MLCLLTNLEWLISFFQHFSFDINFYETSLRKCYSVSMWTSFSMDSHMWHLMDKLFPGFSHVASRGQAFPRILTCGISWTSFSQDSHLWHLMDKLFAGFSHVASHGQAFRRILTCGISWTSFSQDSHLWHLVDKLFTGFSHVASQTSLMH